MEKGQHGYMNRHKRNVLISIIVLGLFVIAGVFFTVAMFDTRKTVFIVIPILVALPLAKQLVAYIMCAGFKELTKNEFYYNGGYGKKIPDEAALKKIITEALADQKKYVVIITTDIDGFVAKAEKIKAPSDEFVGADEKIRNRLYELGI